MRNNAMVITLAMVCFSTSAFAETVSVDDNRFHRPTNGYTNVVVDTNYEQRYPLRTVISFEFPREVINVGQALNYILENSGYKLIKLNDTELETLKLYSLPIPLIHRQFYSASILQVATALVGNAFDVNVNHVSREITVLPSA
ncbi:hypothetical protein [Vibrio agarivorans]|uniref:Pili assembly chaperone n=1 Tax=Vibrio agarivorans TaxID=153622 RepID=A0ABT7Y766_9VIBR|nr:hypothetical protein [Vibrio agarivorans]MDN2483828.1 hypothetical protein [Vibrio agarivorans]